jgi:hypothetical protein
MNKLFHRQRPASWAIRHDDSITVLEGDKVPTDAMRMLRPLIDEFQQLGARLAFYHTLQTTKNLECFAAVLRSAEQNAVITCAWTRTQIARPGKQDAVCALTSRLQDGTFLSTTNWRSPFDKAPGLKTLRCRRASPGKLYRRHEEALARSDSGPIPVRNEQDAIKILVEAIRRKFEWKLRRGVLVPLTPAEQTNLGLSSEG